MTKHIAIDARGYSTSTGRYVRKLIENLELLDTHNKYSILLKSRDWDKYEPGVKNFTKVQAEFTEFTLAEQLGFKRLLNKLGVDLVHFTMPNQPIFYRGKKVTTIHDLTRLRFGNPSSNLSVFKFRQKIFGHVIKQVTSKSLAIITPSQFIKDDLVSFTKIDPNKITVTYEAADEIMRPTKPVSKLLDQQYLLYVGQAYSHKNLQNFVRSFAKLRQTNHSLKLVLAGRKTANHITLKQWIDEQNIDGIVFTDFINDTQLGWLYKNARCYVFPSLSEGFGLPGLEAMTHDCPVVSSNATCLPEIYGDAAHYFDPNDVNDMTKKIQEVLGDKKLRSQLISNGKKQLEKYSWGKMARQTLEIYESILS